MRWIWHYKFNLFSFSVFCCFSFILFNLINASISAVSLQNDVELTRSGHSCYLVSSLDGLITALDPLSGDVLWTLNSDMGPLLSTSLDQLQIYNNDVNLKLIPSLDGTLWIFGPNGLQSVPFSADSLLSSSIKLGNSDVLSGAKQVLTIGVNLHTGQLLYRCEASGCRVSGPLSSDSQNSPLLILRLLSQTIRAFDARTGLESWNLSVAQWSIQGNNDAVDDYRPDDNDFVHVQFSFPDGLIKGESKTTKVPVWSYQLKAPISQIWRVTDDHATELSIFDPELVPNVINLNSNFPKSNIRGTANDSPHFSRQHAITEDVIYIGTFSGQKYVITPVIDRSKNALIQHHQTNALTGSTLYLAAPASPGSEEVEKEYSGSTCNSDQVNYLMNVPSRDKDYGWYLFRHKQSALPQITWNSGQTGYRHLDMREGIFTRQWFMNVFFVTVFAILVTVLVQCYVLRYIFFKRKNKKFDKQLSDKGSLIGSSTTSTPDTGSSSANSISQFFAPVQSRFQSDFDVIKVLGRGGFGLVYEARNKLDDQCYAVKKVILSDDPSQRAKILREVKALAQLDHPCIVRYYQAWTEIANDDSSTTVIVNKDVSVADNDNTNCGSNYANSPSDSICSFKKVNDESLNNIINEKSDSLEIIFAADALSEAIDPNLPSTSTNCAPRLKSKSFNIGNDDVDEDVDGSSDKLLSISDSKLKNVLEKQQSTQHEMHLYIQMQLCKEQTLRNWLEANVDTRDFKKCLLWFVQILSAVQYVHDRGLIHRDLKPSNIFFTSDGEQVRVGDFGLVTFGGPNENTFLNEIINANLVTTKKKTKLKLKIPSNLFSKSGSFVFDTDPVGTKIYMSPEQLNGAFNYKVDVYSLGLVLLECLVPFRTAMQRHHVLSNARLGHFPSEISEFFQALLVEMLNSNANRRPDCKEVKERIDVYNVNN